MRLSLVVPGGIHPHHRRHLILEPPGQLLLWHRFQAGLVVAPKHAGRSYILWDPRSVPRS